jgi:ZIP family zinc transporter
MFELVLVASGTAFATGLGVIPVALLGQRAAALRPTLLAIAAGTMLVAAIAGLLAPAFRQGSALEALAGTAAGVGFLVLARSALAPSRRELAVARRTSLLVFAVLLVHSLPEGFAIGTAYASSTAGLGLFIIVAIAVQNIPEGTSIAVSMEAAGFGTARQFWAAVLSSAPQPVGAVIAYVLVSEITALLPISFAFAAGAMLALVAIELIPEAVRSGAGGQALLGFAAGGAAMLALSLTLGV